MARRISARTIGVAALIAALAWLNLFQYFAKPGPPGEPSPGGPAKVDLKRDRQVIDRFHELAYDQQFHFMSAGGDFQTATRDYTPSKWLGIVTQQNPADAWVHQEIITEQKPDLIVETGTLLGGGALLWATILEQVNPEGRVLTIDIEDRVKGAKDVPLFQRRVDRIVASSTAPGTVAEVKRRAAGKAVLFILDSNHTRDHVLAELRAYAPLVKVGGYVIVQDSNVNGHPLLPGHGPGPYEAIEAFLKEDGRFVADRSRERFLFTMHPMGYLKRVK